MYQFNLSREHLLDDSSRYAINLSLKEIRTSCWRLLDSGQENLENSDRQLFDPTFEIFKRSLPSLSTPKLGVGYVGGACYGTSSLEYKAKGEQGADLPERVLDRLEEVSESIAEV